MPPESNTDLIPIYKDWANRNLLRHHAKPLNDLTNDLRDPKILLTLIRAITSDCVPGSKDRLSAAIAGQQSAEDTVNGCLNFLVSLGVSVGHISPNAILNGQLGAILSLLYSLSAFKQQCRKCAKVSASTDCRPSTSSFKPKTVQRSESSSISGDKMPPSSRLPSPAIHGSASSQQSSHHSGIPSKLVTPSRSTAKQAHLHAPTDIRVQNPTSKLSSLKPPSSRLHAPTSIKTSACNNNEQLRPVSRTSSIASSSTYSSVPSSCSTPSTSSVPTPPSANSNMLKIKFFGGAKEKDKNKTKSASIATKDERSSKSNNNAPKTMNTIKSKMTVTRNTEKTPNQMSRPSVVDQKGPTSMSKISSQQISSPVSKKHRSRLPASSTALVSLKPPSLLNDKPNDKRHSKSSEDDSAYAGFGSCSPISSTESSSMSLNSASSKNSSVCGVQIRTRVPPPNTLVSRTSVDVNDSDENTEHRYPPTPQLPPNSPSDPKPVLAVKGVAVPRGSRLAAPKSLTFTKVPCNSPPSGGAGSPECPAQSSPPLENAAPLPTLVTSKTEHRLSLDQPPSQQIVNLPRSCSVAISKPNTQSPTIGVVSPMLSHRSVKITVPSVGDAGNQSDASTTSGSRDSDNVSVIYNPSDDSANRKNAIAHPRSHLEKRAPPVPTRTTSRLETTFDSNYSVTTTELPTVSESSLEGIVPMEPLSSRVAASFVTNTRNQLPQRHRVVDHHQRSGEDRLLVPDISTSEDSLHSLHPTPRCSLSGHSAGYFSEGEPRTLPTGAIPRLTTADTQIGYVSEGGITVYAKKMQARFREGLEAVRDSMRNRHHDYNDSFEDSSSLSSGISENLDDISTDDLTGSSLSDHPMAAAATYGKYSDYQRIGRQISQRRSSSASVARSTSNSARLHQRRLLEQENIEQLLEKCRSNHRGISSNEQNTRYTDSHRPIYHTLGAVGNQLHQLALSDDGDTLCCIRSDAGRSSMRLPSKQDHQVQAGPGLTALSGYHSLDRKAHLINYYRSFDDTPYRLTAITHDTSAATLALVSPRRTTNTQHLSLAPSSTDNGHPTRHSLTGMPRSARGVQGEAIYANTSHREGDLQLHKLSEDTSCGSMRSSRQAESTYTSNTSRSTHNGPSESNGSQLSLVSSSGSAYASVEEKYEAEIRKLNHEMESYRATINKLTAKHDGYNHLIQLFDSKLQLMGKHVENLQNNSHIKKEEVVKLRSEIDHLRVMSISVGINVPSTAAINGDHKGSKLSCPGRTTMDGAGELLRHPSLESVASHRSSMSSSSKGSKTDKSSLNSFGKQGKKSWIRNSFSRAFTKGKKGKNGSVSDAEHSPMHMSGTANITDKKQLSGSANRLDEIESIPQIVALRKLLEDKDSALTDIRLDALDKAREVDLLKETVNKLKTENKVLKQNYTLLERKVRAESRVSSEHSLCAFPDDDPVYEVPPTSSDRSVSGSTGKHSDGYVKVSVSVELSGQLQSSSPLSEISIGQLSRPSESATWQDIDTLLFDLFQEYIKRIDPQGTLELQAQNSMIGYEIGDAVRNIISNSCPRGTPSSLLKDSGSIRVYLKGVSQRGLDGLILDCLFPRAMLDQLLSVLIQFRRLVLFGATGIGKSNLARQLAKYISIMIGGSTQDNIVDIKISDDDHDRSIAQTQRQLESLLRSSKPTVILIDNIQRHRMAFLSSSFASVQIPAEEGPYVICTVNRASQLPEMQVHHNFRMFLLPNHMDAIKGFMGRFLRRRILELEFHDGERFPPEIYRIIDFLPKVLSSVNAFIEKANSRDVTIGPRLFLQCPLDFTKSREWFIKLWNQMIIPYMIKVAKEGVKVLGRCGSFEDPTDLVCEQWPWIEGPSAEQVLQRLSIKESMTIPLNSQFDPLEALIRIQSNNANPQQEVA